MADAAPKLVVQNEEKKPAAVATEFQPFVKLRREIDRLFDDFEWGPWRLPSPHRLFDVEPFWRGEISWGKVPAVDVGETEKTYEITAELPGMDEKNVEVKFAGGVLTIKGEKKEQKEEKKKDYHLSERRYGAFQRSFTVPDGVDAEKIEAAFKDGVLKVSLPKTPEAQKQEKQIAIKKG
jgi:HSP20 family protein